MQSAMKIPGLASALHLIGVHGDNDGAGSAGASGAVAATSNGSSGHEAVSDGLRSQRGAGATEDAYGRAAAGASSLGSNGDGHVLPALNGPVPLLNGHANGHSVDAAGSGDALVVADPAAWVGNNIAPYNTATTAAPASSSSSSSSSASAAVPPAAWDGTSPASPAHASPAAAVAAPSSLAQPGASAGSLAAAPGATPGSLAPATPTSLAPPGAGPGSLASQIRDIASTLRAINALRTEYLERIAQQEMDIAARDEALRSREERIAALEAEAEDLRRSLAMLQESREATEVELKRLREAAAAAAAAATAAAQAPALAPTAAASTPPAATASAAAASSALAQTPSPATAGPSAATTIAAPAVAPTTAPPPPPSPTHAATTLPPPAVFADAPAFAPGPVLTPTSAPPPPPPPPPPRVPEIVLSYRSGWEAAYLHVNVDGRGWSSPPGMRMQHTGSKEHSIRLQAHAIEFVLNNGGSEWDTPGGGYGRNYRIEAPGEYRLHSGAIALVRAWAP